jgi:DNA-binding transcriptional MerR regulator/methylmalonyl-CoA mutase cobalamin-binding subunit
VFVIGDIGFPMKAAARRTGLTPHVIRIWERRYDAVRPERTGTNRRRYSEHDIQRLVLLKGAVDAGHGIGNVARLSNEKLAELGGAMHSVSRPSIRLDAAAEAGAAELLQQAMEAVRALDSQRLESVLNRGLVMLSRPVLLEKLILPLLRGIGDLWQEGELRVAHEHLTSGVIRTFLGVLLQSSRRSSSRSSIIFATPSGQLHELGALAAAVTAASGGWRVTWLGPNIPAEEMAAAAAHSGARAVCLSVLYPPDDPGLVAEFERLREFLTPSARIIVGGSAASAYESVLKSIGALVLPDIGSIRREIALLAGPGDRQGFKETTGHSG